ncbi:MAG TPA: glycosyltransferase, partial [Candidatus Paceibacterota bacterium]|nr:glycosyltransferase [Candidatus Paceibacterota bacterium]
NLPHEEIDLGRQVGVTRFSSIFFGAGSGQGRMVVPYGLRYLKVKAFNPDVIHTQTFFGTGLEALIASRALHVPLVGTNHTAIKSFLIYNPVKAGWTDNLIIKYVNWYYAQCEIVTAPSRSVFREMEESGFHKRGIPLSNPIETDIFRPLPDREALRKRFKFGHYPIVHAGRLAKERSIDVMIRALPLVKRSLPDAELIFSGRGADEPVFRKLAADLGVADSVKFLGFLDQPRLVEAYNAGKVFAITSTSDTQSMVTMQAMACGLPVVGVNARALPEYITPDTGYIVEPGDPAALAERLVAVLKDPALEARLGAGGRKKALQFSPPKIADRWEAIYRDAIGQYRTKGQAV